MHVKITRHWKSSLSRVHQNRASKKPLLAGWSTVYQIAFVPARKPYRIGLLFTNKDGNVETSGFCIGANCTAPILRVDRQISDRFLYFTLRGSVRALFIEGWSIFMSTWQAIQYSTNIRNSCPNTKMVWSLTLHSQFLVIAYSLGTAIVSL